MYSVSSGVLLKYRQNTDRLHVEIQTKYRKMMVKTDKIQKKLLYIMLKCSVNEAIFHFTTIIICSKKENHNREETPICNHRTFFQVHQKKYFQRGDRETVNTIERWKLDCLLLAGKVRVS